MTSPDLEVDAAIDGVRLAAHTYVAAAWRRLLAEHVLPVPTYARFVRVGRDYFGSVDPESFAALEFAMTATYARFGEEIPLADRDFPANFIHSFLSLCIARITRDGDGVTLDAAIIERCVDDLLRVVASNAEEVACIRTVAHMRTADGNPLNLGDITVVPVVADAASRRRAIAEIHERAAFGAGQFIAREEPFAYAPPESVVVATGRGLDPFDEIERASGRIQRLLTGVRLLHGSTCHATYEVRGGVEPIRFSSLHLVNFRGNHPGPWSPTGLIRRTAVLGEPDRERLAGINRLVSILDVGNEDKHFTSMRTAHYKFILSFHAHEWWDQIVDLSTALEGALSGTDSTDVILRLKTRAAALLATPEDPAQEIFNDLGVLYGLRSKLVHGGEISTKSLSREISKITTVPKADMLGIATAHAVDRLRDLVRRALLCRLALATGDEPPWPISRDPGVDAALADDRTRRAWRLAWRETLSGFDAAWSADRVRPGTHALGTDDTEQADGHGTTE